MTVETTATLVTPAGPSALRSPRVAGLLIAGSLSTLTLAVFLRIGLAGDFADSGNTLEGFPYDALVVTIGLSVGLFLGWLAGPTVTATRHPILWVIGLSLLAPPLGGLVFLVLTGVQTALGDGDYARWITWLPLVAVYSYVIALPSTIVVSIVGTLLLRLKGPSHRALSAITLALTVLAVIVGAAAFTTTVGTFGVGPGAPQPIPTQAVSPPLPRTEAIELAEPYATELSRTPAVFESAAAYDMADLCAADDPMPGFECEYSGVAWVVRFSITGPDGQLGAVEVFLDGDTGEMMFTSQ